MIYRECFEGGNPNNKKLYEFYKWCECEGCKTRGLLKREPPNRKTVTTDNLSNQEEIERSLEAWRCEDGSKKLRTVYERILEVQR